MNDSSLKVANIHEALERAKILQAQLEEALARVQFMCEQLEEALKDQGAVPAQNRVFLAPIRQRPRVAPPDIFTGIHSAFDLFGLALVPDHEHSAFHAVGWGRSDEKMASQTTSEHVTA